VDEALETLPDYLRPGLAIVSIGLNPSVRSVKAGFYFANPQNRFWRALNASGLVPEVLEPGAAAMQTLFEVYGIGFTDVVKRPTPSGADLRAADFREGAPVLREKLLRYRPAVAWFHGRVAYGHYLRYAEGVEEPVPWGEQARRIGESRVFVTPSPSPANAGFSLAVIIDGYRALKALRDKSIDKVVSQFES
jgi:TDG/mug DNA glycosylase family protein